MYAHVYTCTCEGSGTTHDDPISTSRTIERKKESTALLRIARRRIYVLVAKKSARKRHVCTSHIYSRYSAFDVHKIRPFLQTFPVSFSLSPSLAPSLARLPRAPSPPARRAPRAGNVPTQWRLTDCTWDNRSPG